MFLYLTKYDFIMDAQGSVKVWKFNLIQDIFSLIYLMETGK